MSRESHAHPLPRWLMPMAVVAMLLLAVAPLRFTKWVGWFSEQAYVVVSPVAHPVTAASGFIFPETKINPGSSERERTLEDERDRWRLRLEQSELRVRELEELINTLSRGAALHPNVEVVQLPRPRIGEVGELLLIRAGTADGVYKGTVVTARSVQLVGRVTESDTRTCRVLPITAAARGTARRIAGVVMLDDQSGRRADCILEPVGDGTLAGYVSPPAEGGIDELAVNQTVRLLDDQWPRHAQMLIIGEVLRIEPHPDQPLRRRIIVGPTVDPRRASEVILRMDAPGDGGDE